MLKEEKSGFLVVVIGEGHWKDGGPMMDTTEQKHYLEMMKIYVTLNSF